MISLRERGQRCLVDGLLEVGHLYDGLLGVTDLVVQHGVDLDGYRILGDGLLRLDVHGPSSDVDGPGPLQYRIDRVQSRSLDGLEPTKPKDHSPLVLLCDPDAC
jgi:hypothetical protein